MCLLTRFFTFPLVLYAMLINFCFKRFFHQYFTRKDEKEKAKAAKGRKRKGDEDKDDDEDDEEADGAGKASLDDEILKVDDEDDSDPDEADIWKVNLSQRSFWEVF